MVRAFLLRITGFQPAAATLWKGRHGLKTRDTKAARYGRRSWGKSLQPDETKWNAMKRPSHQTPKLTPAARRHRNGLPDHLIRTGRMKMPSIFPPSKATPHHRR